MNSRIINWTNGKKNITSLASLELGISPKYIEALFKGLSSGEIYKKFPVNIPVIDWLLFYRDHRHIKYVLADSFLNRQFKEFPNSEVLFLLDNLRFLNKLSKKKQEQISRIITKQVLLNKELFLKQRDQVKTNIENFNKDALSSVSGSNKEFVGVNEDCFSKPEMAFFMRVIMPCWIYYREMPSILFHKARVGKFDAIKNLLVFDKLIVQDHRILKHMQQKWDKGNDGLMKAFAYKPKKLSKKVIKNRVASLIQTFISPFDKINEPQIRELFDAIAYEKSGGKSIIDSDLPLEPASFSKTLQRERKKWNINL